MARRTNPSGRTQRHLLAVPPATQSQGVTQVWEGTLAGSLLQRPHVRTAMREGAGGITSFVPKLVTPPWPWPESCGPRIPRAGGLHQGLRESDYTQNLLAFHRLRVMLQ